MTESPYNALYVQIDCNFLGFVTPFGMKYPLTDYGTPEEEAYRWKFVPWYIRYNRIKDSYLCKVKYYDKPEGTDLLGKLIAINRCVIPFAFVGGAAYCTMHAPKPGFQGMAGQFVRAAWPLPAAATAFATVAYFGAKFRQTDDLYVNKYFFNFFRNSC